MSKYKNFMTIGNVPAKTKTCLKYNFSTDPCNSTLIADLTIKIFEKRSL